MKKHLVIAGAMGVLVAGTVAYAQTYGTTGDQPGTMSGRSATGAGGAMNNSAAQGSMGGQGSQSGYGSGSMSGMAGERG